MTVYLDSVVLIYLMEGQESFNSLAMSSIIYYKKEGYRLMTSHVTVGEVLSTGTITLDVFLEYISKADVDLITLDLNVFVNWAQLRQKTKRSIQPMDMLHLAGAIANNADIFLTNDYQLGKLELEEIKVVMLAEYTV